MNPIQRISPIKILAIIFVFLLAVTACRAAPTGGPAVTVVPPTQEPLEATATAKPELLVLVDPQGSAGDKVMALLSGFASANNLLFETHTSLDELTDSVRIAVVLDATEGLIATADSFPQTQFIGIGGVKLAPSSNLSVIQNKPEDLAFMAGQLATLVAEDWRSGGLLSANNAPIDVISDAFSNGGSYVCGTCYPAYPPYNSSPLFQDVSGKAGAAMGADVETLRTNWVAVTFVSQAADLPEVVAALKAAEIALIGENTKSADAASFAAILDFDAASALEKMLPELLAGQGGQEAVSRVVLAVVNDATLVTPGRQALFNTAAEALQGGWIIPLSIP